MPFSLIINEFLKAIAWVIAIFVMVEFIKSKDGELRKIMIAYFAIEVFIYLSSSIYSYLEWKHIEIISRMVFSDITVSIKDVVKIWLLSWFIRQRRK